VLFGVLVTRAGLAIAAPSEPCEPSEPSADADAPVQIDAAVVRVEGLDAEALEAELQLRSPERELCDKAREAAAGGRTFAFVDVRVEDGGDVSLAIVVSDGRAYFRTVGQAKAGGAPVRVVGASLDNLLAAIEESRVEPDAVDVPLPEEPEHVFERLPEFDDDERDDLEPEVPPPPAPKWSMFFDVGPALTLAIGPPSPAGLASIGGQAMVDVRHTQGGMITVAVRGGGREVDGFVAGRARISAGGGFARCFGSFDLTAAVLVDVEPLWVRAQGSRTSILRPDGEQRDAVWSLGGHARIGAAWVPRIATLENEGAADRWVRLRLGPTVEVGGTGLATGGVARLQRPSDDGGATPVDLLRAGGLEVSVLLQLGIGLQLAP